LLIAFPEDIEMQIDRRALCSFFPLALLTTAWASVEPPLTSGTFRFGELQPRQNANGSGEVRSIVKGTTPTGEQVEVHETALRPGGSPHPPHRHKHSEFWLIREGTVEITINGKPYQLGPGSAAFAASNDEHGIKNVGDIPASYFVVAIGPM
jgi:quercetin dioxygenase-like cupin family protein